MLRPRCKPLYIIKMFEEDEYPDEERQVDIHGLRLEKVKEEGHCRRPGQGAGGNVPPFKEHENKNNEAQPYCRGTQGKIHAERSGNTFASFETKKQGEKVTRECRESDGGNHKYGKTCMERKDCGYEALCRVQEESDDPHRLACGPHHVGGADVSTTHFPWIFAFYSRKDYAYRYGADEIGSDDIDGGVHVLRILEQARVVNLFEGVEKGLRCAAT